MHETAQEESLVSSCSGWFEAFGSEFFAELNAGAAKSMHDSFVKVACAMLREIAHSFRKPE